jgi:hypothetical protein
VFEPDGYQVKMQRIMPSAAYLAVVRHTLLFPAAAAVALTAVVHSARGEFGHHRVLDPHGLQQTYALLEVAIRGGTAVFSASPLCAVCVVFVCRRLGQQRQQQSCKSCVAGPIITLCLQPIQ